MAQYVIGDVHGQFASFCRLLQGAGLVDGTFAWSGEDAALFLMGDFFGHSTTPGPHGLAAVDLTMRLEAAAAAAGGEVAALLGNHDVLILAARRFGHLSLKGGPIDFLARWREDGGAEEDLENLTPRHVAWLESLPAMLRAGETLLVHADAALYEAYGATVEEVNAAFATILKGDDAKAFHHLLDAFGEHNAFRDEEGKARAKRFLSLYGGQKIIHGHTPISKGRALEAEAVTEAEIYADGLCVNVDGGMYRGGPGFVYKL